MGRHLITQSKSFGKPSQADMLHLAARIIGAALRKGSNGPNPSNIDGTLNGLVAPRDAKASASYSRRPSMHGGTPHAPKVETMHPASEFLPPA